MFGIVWRMFGLFELFEFLRLFYRILYIDSYVL